MKWGETLRQRPVNQVLCVGWDVTLGLAFPSLGLFQTLIVQMLFSVPKANMTLLFFLNPSLNWIDKEVIVFKNASYGIQFQRERTPILFNPEWQWTGRAAFQFGGKFLTNCTLTWPIAKHTDYFLHTWWPEGLVIHIILLVVLSFTIRSSKEIPWADLPLNFLF